MRLRPTLVAATVVVSALAGTRATAQVHEVPAVLWDRPRTGTSVLAQESVKRAVEAALARPEARLVIHHPSPHEAALQAEELRAWLTALGLDPARIALRGGALDTQLKIEVME